MLRTVRNSWKHRRSFLSAAKAPVACCLLLVFVAAAVTAQGAPPNIVVIVVDDLGWTDVGCFGSTFCETPRIDQLAAQGIRFTDGYAACPVCSPTRASLQTGRSPARLNTTEWFGGPQPEDATSRLKKRFASRPLLPAPYLEYLPAEEQTLAEALQTRGYKTFFAGKWHLGGKGYLPEDQGYMSNLGGHEKGSPPGGYFSPYKNPKLPDGPPGEHLPDRLANESVRFIQQSADQPFLLCLAFYSVHNPQQGRPDLVEKYRCKAENFSWEGPEFLPEGEYHNRQVQNQPVYGAMVEAVDLAVGKVLDSLEAAGLEDNTVVLFTSDNGGLSTAEGSPTSNLPLRAGKGWLYEGGIRVPWIIRWPGVTQPGTVSNEPITSDDVMPTLRKIAGVTEPPPAPLDGRSLVPLMKDPSASLSRNLYWHYPHYSNQGGTPAGAIRSGPWKLIEHYEDGRLELYNLAQDVGETRNLVDANPAFAQELLARLADWRHEVEAAMPTVNPNYTPRED